MLCDLKADTARWC